LTRNGGCQVWSRLRDCNKIEPSVFKKSCRSHRAKKFTSRLISVFVCSNAAIIPRTVRAGGFGTQQQGGASRLRETGIDENSVAGRLRTAGSHEDRSGDRLPSGGIMATHKPKLSHCLDNGSPTPLAQTANHHLAAVVVRLAALQSFAAASWHWQRRFAAWHEMSAVIQYSARETPCRLCW
jgi:hypothetical protein